MKSSFILRWMRYRVLHQDQFILAFCDGAQGTGKSTAMLALAEALDPFFNVKRVAHTMDEFYNIIHPSPPPKGSVVIFEELGINTHNLNFWSAENKSFNYFCQIARDLNLIILCTAVRSQQIDKQIKCLFHMHFVAYPGGMNRRLGFNMLKCYRLKMMTGKREPYTLFFRKYDHQRGCFRAIKHVIVYKPSDYLIQEYKKYDKEYRESVRNKQQAILMHKQIALFEKTKDLPTFS